MWPGVPEHIEPIPDVDDVDQPVANDREAPDDDLVGSGRESRVLVGNGRQRRRREPACLLWVAGIRDIDRLLAARVPGVEDQIPGDRWIMRGVGIELILAGSR